jgi:hypothetical protein
MTRTILAGLAVTVLTAAFAGTGCQSTGIGDPCTPEQEYDPTFAGFVEQEVSTEGESFQCQTRLCLVNHFQGRVSCPYGQGWDATGKKVTVNAPATQACTTPAGVPVTGPLDSSGAPIDTKNGEAVNPQCLDRTADKTVYCSCRCADINGNTTGGNFCSCPDGFTCTQLVSSLSAASDQGLTGAYCIKAKTAFSAGATSMTAGACLAGACGDNNATNCGSVDNNGGS